MKVIYIAGPFRAPTQWGIAENVRAAERWGKVVGEMGAMPLIPHANTAHFHGLMTDEFWIEGTKELLRRCDAALMIPGWEKSTGARGEKAEAERLGMPVFEVQRHVSYAFHEQAPESAMPEAFANWLSQSDDEKSPVFMYQGKWYYWDETFTIRHGPFEAQRIANDALMEYARQLTAGPKTTCSLCGEMQFSTPSGITCKNGHGGAPPK